MWLRNDKPSKRIVRKVDKVEGNPVFRDFQSDYQLKISAKTGQGLSELSELLGTILRSRKCMPPLLFCSEPD